MRQLLSGNEAIALGAFDAGVKVAVGYPGTPSTEILETMARWPEVHSQWSPNEKVALEVALGASLGGGRALATMKHVGLNVAADPLFTSVYTGVSAGLVIVSADDPGQHSSQNEQDNRHYARSAKLPLLEPSDSADAYEMARIGFEISERFDTPVLLRSVTRVSHSKSPVEPGERIVPDLIPFRKNPAKYVMVPANAKKRRYVLEDRLKALANYSEETPLNRFEWRDEEVGIIASGISYQYAREGAPNASILKLGMPFPLPERLIREFAGRVKRLIVAEELEPFLEDQIRALGIPCEGRSLFPSIGEMNPLMVAKAVRGADEAPQAEKPAPASKPSFPNRPPVMCPGCPHRAVFHVLSELGVVVFGDIGCYTLGVAPPLSAMDTCVCMGSGIGMALGAEKAGMKEPSVAVIGDSTFVHSGITPLIDIVYNGGNVTVLILDNRTTAMTGRQDHPATGKTLSGDPAPSLDLEGLARAVGVKDVTVTDPYSRTALDLAIRNALKHDGPSVVIAQRSCALNDRRSWRRGLAIDPETCLNCGICAGLGCPGILPSKEEFGSPLIDSTLCTGCEECLNICPVGAIGWGDHD